MRWCRQLHARTRRQEGHGRDQLPSKHCVHGLTSFSVAFCFPLFGSTCLFTLGEAHSDLQELLAQATSLETAALLTTSGTASSLKEKLASTVAREVTSQPPSLPSPPFSLFSLFSPTSLPRVSISFFLPLVLSSRPSLRETPMLEFLEPRERTRGREGGSNSSEGKSRCKMRTVPRGIQERHSHLDRIHSWVHPFGPALGLELFFDFGPTKIWIMIQTETY